MLTSLIDAKTLYARLTCSALLGAFLASYAAVPATETGFAPAPYALADDDRDDDREDDRDDDRDDNRGGTSIGKKLDTDDDDKRKWTKKVLKKKATKAKIKSKRHKAHRDRDDD